jgi:tRNA wybutosine-synthesizing protein 2
VISPIAFGYLGENIRANRLADRVEASCGDCRDLLSGVYDRLVLGHFEARSFLTDALAHARRGSVLHVHALERVPGESGPGLVQAAVECGSAVSSTYRAVKSAGPCRTHTVHDMVIL